MDVKLTTRSKEYAMAGIDGTESEAMLTVAQGDAKTGSQFQSDCCGGDDDGLVRIVQVWWSVESGKWSRSGWPVL